MGLQRLVQRQLPAADKGTQQVDRGNSSALRWSSQAAPDATPHVGVGTAVQRFEGFEHIEQGDTRKAFATRYLTFRFHDTDFPERQRPFVQWPPKWREFVESEPDEVKRKIRQRVLTDGLTYGEVVALTGDLYADFEQLDDPRATLEQLNRASLKEVATLVPLLRDKGVTTLQLQRASGGRYLALAKLNSTHFSTGERNNKSVYIKAHTAALNAAKANDEATALAMNAIGDHFLTDAFSGGHIEVPRETIVKYFGEVLGGIVSKVLHDQGNSIGIPVTNESGKVWIAYGDNYYDNPNNEQGRQQILEAVEASKLEVAEALGNRDTYQIPRRFAVEALIPVSAPPEVRLTNPLVIKWIAESIVKLKDLASVGTTAKNEIPTLIDNDDTKYAVDWIEGQEPEVLRRVQTAEKVRLFKALYPFVRLEVGGLTDSQSRAIYKLWQSTVSRQARVEIHRKVPARLQRLLDPDQVAEEATEPAQSPRYLQLRAQLDPQGWDFIRKSVEIDRFWRIVWFRLKNLEPPNFISQVYLPLRELRVTAAEAQFAAAELSSATPLQLSVDDFINLSPWNLVQTLRLFRLLREPEQRQQQQRRDVNLGSLVRE